VNQAQHRPLWRSVAPPVAYALISFCYFGLRVLSHPGRDYVGTGRDPQIFIWALGWWPHAVLHGENPFVSHAVWAPAGVNLAWVTSVPGLALAFSPVTVAFGPVVAYNVAAVAIPALAAWTAYLLCLRLSRSVWAALAGGYLFGFSSYVLGQELGHMHVSAVFLLPLVPLLVLRYLDSELTRRGLVLRLGPLLAFQLYLSTEVSLSLLLAIAISLAIAAATRARRGLMAAAKAIGGAYVLAGVLASPLLVYALLGFQSGSINPPAGWDADAENFLVPTDITLVRNAWTSRIAKHFTTNDLERGAYLGIPTLVIIVWYAILFRRRASTWFLVVSLLVAAVCAFGTAFFWQGRDRMTLPWSQLARLPGFDNVLTTRFSVFTALLAAVIASLWLAAPRVPLVVRVVLGVLAVVAILPRVDQSLWYTHPSQPAFFADGLARRCLAPGEIVMMLPYTSNGDSMLWQAESGYRFAMADGHLQPKPPPAFEKYPAVAALDEDGPPPGGTADVEAFARAVGVSAIVVADAVADRWQSLLEPLGKPLHYGGVRIYRLAGKAPATCPRG
jgi:hypothetical protein